MKRGMQVVRGLMLTTLLTSTVVDAARSFPIQEKVELTDLINYDITKESRNLPQERAVTYIDPEPVTDFPDVKSLKYFQIDHNAPGMAKIDRYCTIEDGFYQRLEEICEESKINVMALISVIYGESKFVPDAKNKDPKSSASGILQWVEKSANKLGTTTAQIREMSQLEQLDLVQNYFEMWKGIMKNADFTKVEDVALGVFAPALIGKPLNTVYGDVNGTEIQKRIYGMNSSLDKDNNGQFTIGDYVNKGLSHGFVK